MRIPKYLSPTSINLFIEDEKSFYIRYMSDKRPPRDPQTRPMSIGSSFDAYVKSYLHQTLFGKNHKDSAIYELRTIFEEQVEEHNWDWAWKNGAHAFMLYKDCGALADLMLDLDQAVGEPKFEISIEGMVSSDGDRVNLLGKPDVYFINALGHPVILDWKVNGWCSKSNVSPKKGYLKLRHTSGDKIGDSGAHKDAIPMLHQGMMINVMHKLEDVEQTWATQLGIYGWLCGMDVGGDFIVGLDQLVCKPSGDEFPIVRIAEHRLQIGFEYQKNVFKTAAHVWDIIHSDHIFRQMPVDESQRLCIALDGQAQLEIDLENSDDPKDKLFKEMTKKSW